MCMAKSKRMSKGPARLVGGFLKGCISGAVGTLAMTQFQNLMSRVQKTVKHSDSNPNSGQSGQQETAATEKAAEWLVATATDRKLSRKSRKQAGKILHYAFGAAAGGAYGALAELRP